MKIVIIFLNEKEFKMKNFLKTRQGQYLIYISIFYVFWRVAGIELTIVVALGQILGEIHFQNKS